MLTSALSMLEWPAYLSALPTTALLISHALVPAGDGGSGASVKLSLLPHCLKACASTGACVSDAGVADACVGR